MNEVHIALQGKGGIGKSLICRFLLEHLDGVGIDADPENRTLAECKSLEVRQRDLLDGRGSIDPFAIDSLALEVRQRDLLDGRGSWRMCCLKLAMSSWT